MENRFQMVAEGIIVSALVVLTPIEQEKLECKDLEKAINNIANDLHVKWAVEINGNVATATISKQFGPVVGGSQIHEVEIAATNFMRGIEHLVVPCDTKNISKDEKNYDVIKKMLEEWDDEDRPVAGFVIMREIIPGIAIQCSSIHRDVAKEMCMSYLKVHSNG